MKTAFFDCHAGAAGDMILGALVDAGAAPEDIHAALEQLGLEGWDLNFKEVSRGGVRALKAVVTTSPGPPRNYRDIVNMLDRAELDDEIKRRALNTFELLGRAEARVHGTELDDVHFHEVGSMDAIVDVVGCCAALESLQFERLVCSPIATGTGSVDTAHGPLPLPAPAVAEIVQGSGASLFERGTKELLTPTGAALLVAAGAEFGPMPPMRVDAVGAGAGDAELEFPNVLRVFTGQTLSAQATQTLDLVIETNLDDTSPELLPHLIEKLLDAGAQDAWITPIIMKKGRPAFTVSALCGPELEAEVGSIFFRETTTLGLRARTVYKRALERDWIETQVEGTTVRVKVGRDQGRVTTLAPEHDDAVEAARQSGLPLKEIYARASEAARKEESP